MNTNVLLISVAVAGATEWLKNLLPSKVKENSAVMAVIAGVISACAGVGYSLIAGYSKGKTVAYTGAVIGLVQVSYNTLYQTFKAVIAKIQSKTVTTADADTLAETVVDTIISKTEGILAETTTESTAEETKTE